MAIFDGTEDNDTLTGGAGDDSLSGYGGDDSLSAYLGDDSLYGGEGNDFASFRDASGYFDGGTGDDGISISSLNSGSVALIMTGTSGTLTGSLGMSASFDNTENVEFYGGYYNDTMISAGGDDFFNDSCHIPQGSRAVS